MVLKKQQSLLVILIVLALGASVFFLIQKKKKHAALVQKVRVEAEASKKDLRSLTEHYKDRLPIITDIVQTKKKLNLKGSTPENLALLEKSMKEAAAFQFGAEITNGQINAFDVVQSNISNLTADLLNQIQLQESAQKSPSLMDKIRKLEREEQKILLDRAQYHQKIFEIRKIAKENSIPEDQTIAFPAEENLAKTQAQ